MKFCVVTATVYALGLVLGATGCATHKSTIPLSNGFELVSHPHHTMIDDPPPPRVAVQYHPVGGSVTPIWPSLYSTETVVHSNLVLFVAERGFREPDRVTHGRIFASRPPALPLDLTDEMLWRWSQTNKRDFGTALQKLAGVTPATADDGVDITFQFWAPALVNEAHFDWPDTSALHLSWTQIDELIARVKAKGLPQKDLRWHAEFIGEKY
jgi:hypothetical protein